MIDFYALKLRKKFEPAQQYWIFSCYPFNESEDLQVIIFIFICNDL